MCLAMPMKIEKVEKDCAQVRVGSVRATVNIQLISKPCKGDYVLVHAGIAIEKINSRKAKETRALYRTMKVSER